MVHKHNLEAWIKSHPRVRRLTIFLRSVFRWGKYNLAGRSVWVKKKLRQNELRHRLAFPPLVSLEITNYCNASCVMCPHASMGRPLQHMEPELFRRLIDECAEFSLERLHPFFFGEPLICPHFPEFMDYARSKLPATSINVYTNGAVLQGDNVEALFRNRIDEILVCLDGATKDVYESIRKGLNYDTVVENLVKFMEKKRQKRCLKPVLRIILIEMENNQEEIEQFLRRWRGIADIVEVQMVHNWSGQLQCSPSGDTGLLAPGEKPPRSSGLNRGYPCFQLFNELVVAADGRVPLCCMDYDLKYVIGNVQESSLESIWKNRRINFIRKEQEAGNFGAPEICVDCIRYNILGSRYSYWKKLW